MDPAEPSRTPLITDADPDMTFDVNMWLGQAQDVRSRIRQDIIKTERDFSAKLLKLREQIKDREASIEDKESQISDEIAALRALEEKIQEQKRLIDDLNMDKTQLQNQNMQEDKALKSIEYSLKSIAYILEDVAETFDTLVSTV